MKLFKLNKKKIARGFTLIEVLLVVGFIALASIGVYVVYNKVQTGNAANTEARNVDALRAGVKNIYGGSTSYNGLTNTVALNARIVPDNMRTSGSTTAITNSFGGTVTLGTVTFGTGAAANNAFTIQYAGVPIDVCAKLVTTAGAGFNRVQVNGTEVKSTITATGNELNVATTASSCNQDAGNTLIFTSL